MASIFDVEQKQPVDIHTIWTKGFRPVLGRMEHNKGEHWYELKVAVPFKRGKFTWIARYYPRGTKFNGQVLRSNRFVYKVFDQRKKDKFIKDNAKTNGLSPVVIRHHNSEFYTKKVVRNIGMVEFNALAPILKTYIDKVLEL